MCVCVCVCEREREREWETHQDRVRASMWEKGEEIERNEDRLSVSEDMKEKGTNEWMRYVQQCYAEWGKIWYKIDNWIKAIKAFMISTE